jgi:4'-phosphopantetheinyl transferase
MEQEGAWLCPPENLTLRKDKVHVWRAGLRLAAPRLEALRQTLAEDELNRSLRFHTRQDRDRFITARGLLRSILGRYLGIDPGQVRLCYGAQGKPRLAGQDGPETIRFNLAHSGDLALYAVTRGREIGVDVERIRPELVREPLAERFFSQLESAKLRALPVDQQSEAFFACWTRKEAYLKARGQGLLALPLDQFEVSLAPGEPAALLSVQGDEQEPLRWSLQHLSPEQGYAAALAVEGSGWQLECWRWVQDDA